MTNNLVDWSLNSLWYEYTTVRLTHVLPDNGPVLGGTVLTVMGDGFAASVVYGTWCRFHDGERPVATMPALFVSSRSVLCRTPSLSSLGSSLTTRLFLSLNGRATEDALPYHFLLTLLITTAHPLVGPIDGGTTVIVDGHYFSPKYICGTQLGRSSGIDPFYLLPDPRATLASLVRPE